MRKISAGRGGRERYYRLEMKIYIGAKIDPLHLVPDTFCIVPECYFIGSEKLIALC